MRNLKKKKKKKEKGIKTRKKNLLVLYIYNYWTFVKHCGEFEDDLVNVEYRLEIVALYVSVCVFVSCFFFVVVVFFSGDGEGLSYFLDLAMLLLI